MLAEGKGLGLVDERQRYYNLFCKIFDTSCRPNGICATGCKNTELKYSNYRLVKYV